MTRLRVLDIERTCRVPDRQIAGNSEIESERERKKGIKRSLRPR